MGISHNSNRTLTSSSLLQNFSECVSDIDTPPSIDTIASIYENKFGVNVSSTLTKCPSYINNTLLSGVALSVNPNVTTSSVFNIYNSLAPLGAYYCTSTLYASTPCVYYSTSNDDNINGRLIRSSDIISPLIDYFQVYNYNNRSVSIKTIINNNDNRAIKTEVNMYFTTNNSLTFALAASYSSTSSGSGGTSSIKGVSSNCGFFQKKYGNPDNTVDSLGNIRFNIKCSNASSNNSTRAYKISKLSFVSNGTTYNLSDSNSIQLLGSSNTIAVSMLNVPVKNLIGITSIAITIDLVDYYPYTLSWTNCAVARTLTGSQTTSQTSPFLGTMSTFFNANANDVTAVCSITGNTKIYNISSNTVATNALVDMSSSYPMTCSLSSSTLTFNVPFNLPSGTYLFGVQYKDSSGWFSYIYFYVNWTGSALSFVQSGTSSAPRQVWLDLRKIKGATAEPAMYIRSSYSATLFPWVLYGNTNTQSFNATTTTQGSLITLMLSTTIMGGAGGYIYFNRTTSSVSKSSYVTIGSRLNRYAVLSNFTSFSNYISLTSADLNTIDITS